MGCDLCSESYRFLLVHISMARTKQSVLDRNRSVSQRAALCDRLERRRRATCKAARILSSQEPRPSMVKHPRAPSSNDVEGLATEEEDNENRRAAALPP